MPHDRPFTLFTGQEPHSPYLSYSPFTQLLFTVHDIRTCTFLKLVVYFHKPTGRSIFLKGTMTLQSRAVDTHKTILSTALALFSQNGYDATSVSEICQKAKVSKGAFYHHFSSKQALFLALMASWLEEVDGMIQSASESAVDASQSLQMMAEISGLFFDALEGGFPILLEFWTQASRHPAVWKQAVAPYQRYLDFFAQLFKRGIEQDVFDQNLDTDMTARIIMAMAMGLLLQAAFDPDYKGWQSVTSSGINIILNGLRRKT